MSKNQIQEKINQLEAEAKILRDVLSTPNYSKIGRPANKFKYTEPQVVFLKENKDLPMKDLIQKYNEEFKVDLPKDSRALYNFMERLGIIVPQFRREYFPRSPSAVEKSIETRKK